MQQLINVIYGNNSYLVNEKLNEIIEKHDVLDININRYDLLETANEDVLEDLRTISFFSDNKIVIIDNFKELLNLDNVVIDRWIDYIKKPNPDTFLYIILNDLIPSENNLGKSLMQYAKLIEVKDIDIKEYPKYIIKYLKNNKYTIDKKAVNELLNRTSYDLNLTVQELEKLMLYKLNDKNILYNDVINLVSRNLEENIYELTNNLIRGNQTETIQIYYDLLVNNEDPLRILNNLANRVRQIIHTKLLINKSYTKDDIAKHFNISSGQAYYLTKDSQNANIETLEKLLENLSKLDYDIKTGKIDKKLGLEILLIGAKNV